MKRENAALRGRIERAELLVNRLAFVVEPPGGRIGAGTSVTVDVPVVMAEFPRSTDWHEAASAAPTKPSHCRED